MAGERCELCVAQKEERLVHETPFSFCVVIKWPLKPGHVIVLPKRHVENLDELSPEEAKDLLGHVEFIKQVLLRAYSDSPIIFMNTGAHNTQKHLHIHVLPSKGSLRTLVSNYEGVPARELKADQEMQALVEELRLAILGGLSGVDRSSSPA